MQNNPEKNEVWIHYKNREKTVDKKTKKKKSVENIKGFFFYFWTLCVSLLTPFCISVWKLLYSALPAD